MSFYYYLFDLFIDLVVLEIAGATAVLVQQNDPSLGVVNCHSSTFIVHYHLDE